MADKVLNEYSKLSANVNFKRGKFAGFSDGEEYNLTDDLYFYSENKKQYINIKDILIYVNETKKTYAPVNISEIFDAISDKKTKLYFSSTNEPFESQDLKDVTVLYNKEISTTAVKIVKEYNKISNIKNRKESEFKTKFDIFNGTFDERYGLSDMYFYSTSRKKYINLNELLIYKNDETVREPRSITDLLDAIKGKKEYVYYSNPNVAFRTQDVEDMKKGLYSKDDVELPSNFLTTNINAKDEQLPDGIQRLLRVEEKEWKQDSDDYVFCSIANNVENFYRKSKLGYYEYGKFISILGKPIEDLEGKEIFNIDTNEHIESIYIAKTAEFVETLKRESINLEKGTQTRLALSNYTKSSGLGQFIKLQLEDESKEELVSIDNLFFLENNYYINIEINSKDDLKALFGKKVFIEKDGTFYQSTPLTFNQSDSFYSDSNLLNTTPAIEEIETELDKRFSVHTFKREQTDTGEKPYVYVKNYEINQAIGEFLKLQLKHETNESMYEINSLYTYDKIKDEYAPIKIRSRADLLNLMGKEIFVRTADDEFIATEPLNLAQANVTYSASNFMNPSESTDDILADNSYLKLKDGRYIKEKENIRPKAYDVVADTDIVNGKQIETEFDAYLVQIGEEYKVVNKDFFKLQSEVVIDGQKYKKKNAFKLKLSTKSLKDCDVIQTTSTDARVENCYALNNPMYLQNPETGSDDIGIDPKTEQEKLDILAKSNKEFTERYKEGKYKIDQMLDEDGNLIELANGTKRFVYTNEQRFDDYASQDLSYRFLTKNDVEFVDGKMVDKSKRFDRKKANAAFFRGYGNVLAHSAGAMFGVGGLIALTVAPVAVIAMGVGLVAAPILVPIATGIISIASKIKHREKKYKDKVELNQKGIKKEIIKDLDNLLGKYKNAEKDKLNKLKFLDEITRIEQKLYALSPTNYNAEFRLNNGKGEVNAENVSLFEKYKEEVILLERKVKKLNKIKNRDRTPEEQNDLDVATELLKSRKQEYKSKGMNVKQYKNYERVKGAIKNTKGYGLIQYFDAKLNDEEKEFADLFNMDSFDIKKKNLIKMKKAKFISKSKDSESHATRFRAKLRPEVFYNSKKVIDASGKESFNYKSEKQNERYFSDILQNVADREGHYSYEENITYSKYSNGQQSELDELTKDHQKAAGNEASAEAENEIAPKEEEKKPVLKIATPKRLGEQRLINLEDNIVPALENSGNLTKKEKTSLKNKAKRAVNTMAKYIDHYKDSPDDKKADVIERYKENIKLVSPLIDGKVLEENKASEMSIKNEIKDTEKINEEKLKTEDKSKDAAKTDYDKIEELEARRDEISANYDNARDNVADYNEQMKTINEGISAASNAISHYKSEINTLEGKIEGYNEKLDNFDKMLKNTELRLTTQQAQKVKQATDELNNLKQNVKSEIERLLEEINEREEELAKLNSRKSEIEDELKNAKAEEKELRRELEGITNEIENLKNLNEEADLGI